MEHEPYDSKYIKLDEIGKGAFASVYKCKEKMNNQVFALKIAQITEKLKKYLNTEKNINESMKKKSAENVLYAEDIYINSRFYYFVMPFCDSGTLEDYIKKQGLLSEPEARYFIRKAVKGLSNLHESGIMHRDVKPENLLLKIIPNKKPKHTYEAYELFISDFGLSKEDVFGTTVLGTPVTMAPEIMSGKGKNDYTALADVWSLGIIGYYMLMGVFPFDKMYQLQHLEHQEISIPFSRGLTYACLSFLENCLKLNPDDRYSAAECLKHPFLADEIDDCLRMPISEIVDSQKNHIIKPGSSTYTEIMNKLLAEGKGKDKTIEKIIIEHAKQDWPIVV